MPDLAHIYWPAAWWFMAGCAVFAAVVWLLACAVTDGIHPAAVLRDLSLDLPRRGGMMEGPEVRLPDVPVHAVKPCAAPGQPDALDLLLIAIALPAELVAAAEEAIGEALMILARAADQLAAVA